MKRRTWRWVSRDTEHHNSHNMMTIHKSATRPLLHNGYYLLRPGVMVCERMFREILGFTIAPGECRKVEFSGRLLP